MAPLTSPHLTDPTQQDFVHQHAQPKQFAVIDADGDNAAGLQHLAHHPDAGRHEAQPLAVPRSVILGNEFSEVRIVRVLVPFVVVSKILAKTGL
jgi:hypothetical protein